MPTLEIDGANVDVAQPDPDAVKSAMDAALADTPDGDEAPPRRQEHAPKDDKPAPRRRAKADKSRTTSKPAPQPLDDDARRKGAKGLMQLGAGVALMLGKATKKDAYKADAVTIASAADEMADAAVETAAVDPKFAVALDKVCAVGPYGALITVAAGIGSQIARNHGASVPGTVDPAELLRAQDEAEEAAAAA